MENNLLKKTKNLQTIDKCYPSSPTPTDPGHIQSPNITVCNSPISVKEFRFKHRPSQITCLKIDSYYRDTNDNYLKKMPKTERQKSRSQRIAKLDDAIFELEEMYKKLKLSDQDLLDRAERRDLPCKFQLMRFNSASNIPPISPTPNVKSDEELQHKSKINYELKQRPISAFYDQFQRAPPMRRSAIPDLINDDLAIRKMNSPIQKSNTVNLISPSYLQNTSAYANPLNLQHSSKKNIYGHLEPDPIVDDLQYRKFSQSSNIPPPHPPFGIPLNVIKTNPVNDYLHSSKTNDLAVRSLRKDNQFFVNQSNPFANVLHRSASSNLFHQKQNDILPETTTNYLINVKKKLKPTRSMTLTPMIEYENYPSNFKNNQINENQLDLNQKNLFSSNNEKNKNNFFKSNSLSNCSQSYQQTTKPKNNIYKKYPGVQSTTSLANELRIENMLSNLNQISKNEIKNFKSIDPKQNKENIFLEKKDSKKNTNRKIENVENRKKQDSFQREVFNQNKNLLKSSTHNTLLQKNIIDKNVDLYKIDDKKNQECPKLIWPNKPALKSNRKQYFFMNDEPNEQIDTKNLFCIPDKGSKQVNEMKNFFESKLNKYDTNSNENQLQNTKKSSTQPNFLKVNTNEPVDKKQKKSSKLRKLKSAHALLNRSIQLSYKSKNNNESSNESENLQYSDTESEHETSSDSSSS